MWCYIPGSNCINMFHYFLDILLSPCCLLLECSLLNLLILLILQHGIEYNIWEYSIDLYTILIARYAFVYCILGISKMSLYTSHNLLCLNIIAFSFINSWAGNKRLARSPPHRIYSFFYWCFTCFPVGAWAFFLDFSWNLLN